MGRHMATENTTEGQLVTCTNCVQLRDLKNCVVR